jgi:hypothetical protein
MFMVQYTQIYTSEQQLDKTKTPFITTLSLCPGFPRILFPAGATQYTNLCLQIGDFLLEFLDDGIL